MRGRPGDRLAGVVERLLRDRRPGRFRARPEEIAALRAAGALRSLRPGAARPAPEFVDRLERRLRAEHGEAGGLPRPLSRRALLAGGGAAAAGLVLGALGERALVPAPAQAGRELVPNGATWRPVAASASLPEGGALRFRAGAVEGWLLRQDGRVAALSAACTHLGCLLSADTGRHRLDCPCHRTSFAWSGEVAEHQLARAPAPLPRLGAREREGVIDVLA